MEWEGESRLCLIILLTTYGINAWVSECWLSRRTGLTSPSSCTLVTGISPSVSMTFDMEAGIASYVGAAGVGAACGAGSDAARVAASVMVLAIVTTSGGQL